MQLLLKIQNLLVYLDHSNVWVGQQVSTKFKSFAVKINTNLLMLVFMKRMISGFVLGCNVLGYNETCNISINMSSWSHTPICLWTLMLPIIKMFLWYPVMPSQKAGPPIFDPDNKVVEIYGPVAKHHGHKYSDGVWKHFCSTDNTILWTSHISVNKSHCICQLLPGLRKIQDR